MPIILLLLILLFSVAALLALIATAATGWIDASEIVTKFFSYAIWEVVAVPVAASWVTLEFLSRLSPRTIFDRRRPCFRNRLAFVAAIVFTWVVLEVLSLWLLRTSISEISLTALAASLASIPAFLFCQHAKDGFCVVCNYDLRPTPKEAPCPECGKTSTRFTLPLPNPNSPAHRVPP